MLLAVEEEAAGWIYLGSVITGDAAGERGDLLLRAAQRHLDAALEAALGRTSPRPEARTEVVAGPLWPVLTERLASGSFDVVVLEARTSGEGRLSASARLYRLLGEGAPPAVLLVPAGEQDGE